MLQLEGCHKLVDRPPLARDSHVQRSYNVDIGESYRSPHTPLEAGVQTLVAGFTLKGKRGGRGGWGVTPLLSSFSCAG